MTENEAKRFLKIEKECINRNCDRNCAECDLVQKVEDLNSAYDAAIKALEEVQQYRTIGTPEECKIAVKKQRPKKPINPDDDYGTFKCPNCNGLIFTEDRFETHKYCLLCGQKLDWRDEE